jgi:hypothetical protein
LPLPLPDRIGRGGTVHPYAALFRIAAGSATSGLLQRGDGAGGAL